MTFKITVQTAVPTPQGLSLGLRIEHEKAGWVRFGVTTLVVDQLRYWEKQELIEWLETSLPSHYQDESLF